MTAVLLAAGMSRRMVAFKPLLPFGGQMVIEAAIENLRGAGVEKIVVVIGHRAAEMRSRIKDLSERDEAARLETVENSLLESQMSDSIKLGVAHAASSSRAVIIALADQPSVSSDVIKRLIHVWRETGAQLVAPEYAGRGGHPVLVDLSLRERLLALDSDGGLRRLFDERHNEIVRVRFEDEFVVRDMDTWEEYIKLHVDTFGYAPNIGKPSV